MSFEPDFFAAGLASGSGDEIFTQSYNLKPGVYHFSAISPTSAELDMALSVTTRRGRILHSADDRLGSYDPGITFEVTRRGKYGINVSWSAKADSAGLGDLEFELQGFNLDKLESPETEYSPIEDPLTGIDDDGVEAFFNSIISDGEVSKSELEDLLRDIGSSGGVVTQQEFDDLRTISYNLGDFVMGDKKEYIQQIFDNVVLGSPANAYWTGGLTTRSPLGNLSAGSSSEQMDKLVDKWFQGLDLPDPNMAGDAARDQEDSVGVYKTATGPLFGDVISYTDVNQGGLGDCWFLAAAASVASYNPERIRDIFIDNGDGTYGVAFYELNSNLESEGSGRHWVTVNADLPTITLSDGTTILAAAAGTTARTLDGVMWPALLEKAAAQASEIGIFAKARPTGTDNAYFSIAGGMDEGLAILEPTSLFLTLTRPIGWTVDASPYRFQRLSSRGQWNDFVSNYDAIYASGGGSGIALSSINLDRDFDPWTAGQVKTMVAGHALAVVDFSHDNSTFTIYNPWGEGSRNAVVPFAMTSRQAFNSYLQPSITQGAPSGFSVAL